VQIGNPRSTVNAPFATRREEEHEKDRF